MAKYSESKECKDKVKKQQAEIKRLITKIQEKTKGFAKDGLTAELYQTIECLKEAAWEEE